MSDQQKISTGPVTTDEFCEIAKDQIGLFNREVAKLTKSMSMIAESLAILLHSTTCAQQETSAAVREILRIEKQRENQNDSA